MRLLGGVGIVAAVVVVGSAVYLNVGQDELEDVVTPVRSFQDCVDRGFPVMESYPRQCRDAEGNTFTEDIGNELSLTDHIRVSTPRPNTVVTNPISITGEAVGGWFFEGDAGAVLKTDDGTVLTSHYIQADGEWMTTDFVPFSGEIEYVLKADTYVDGVLILSQDDPRDADETKEAPLELVIPVRITPTEKPTSGANKCFVSGCSNQLCTDDEDIGTTCEWREEYACYASAKCEVQSTGECGWTPTTELTQCLEEKKQLNDDTVYY